MRSFDVEGNVVDHVGAQMNVELELPRKPAAAKSSC